MILSPTRQSTFLMPLLIKSDIGIILLLTTGGTASGNGVSVFHLDLSLDGRTLIFIELFHRGKNCDMIDKIMTKKSCNYVTLSNCNASKVSSLKMDIYLEQKCQRFRQSQKVSPTFSIQKISFQESSTLFVTVENVDIFAPNISPFSNDDTFKALSFRKNDLNFWSVVRN